MPSQTQGQRGRERGERGASCLICDYMPGHWCYVSHTGQLHIFKPTDKHSASPKGLQADNERIGVFIRPSPGFSTLGFGEL